MLHKAKFCGIGLYLLSRLWILFNGLCEKFIVTYVCQLPSFTTPNLNYLDATPSRKKYTLLIFLNPRTPSTTTKVYTHGKQAGDQNLVDRLAVSFAIK